MFPLNLVYCAVAAFSATIGYQPSKRRNRRSLAERADHVSLQEGYGNSSVKSHENAVENTSPDANSAAASDNQLLPQVSEHARDSSMTGTLKRKIRDDDSTLDLDKGNTVLTLSRPSKKRCQTPLKSLSSQESTSTDLTHGNSTAALKTPLNASEVSTGPPSFLSPSVVRVPAVKPSSAFLSFSGRSAAFLPDTNIAPPSLRAVWCVSADRDLSQTSSARMADDRADVDSAEIVHAFKRDSSILDNPLAAKSYAKGADTTITGEEDEEVKAELKGAKVFIKRGDKDFSDGILGNIKLLSHRETADERLLFRREPVWKVTMSVRLGSAVRCTFDEEQGVLRVMLKESEERVGVSPQRWEQKVVIYAVKRGKASKTDFAAFAHTVSARAQFARPSSAEPSSA